MNAKKGIDRSQPFQSIENACRITGLSIYSLRKGCKDGTVPHIRSGRAIKINVPALLEKLGVPND